MDISIKDLILTQAMQILPIHQLIPMQWIDGEVLVEKTVTSIHTRTDGGHGEGNGVI